MSYGVQFVSLSVILIILFNYFQSERMDFMSTKCFSTFLLLALFNILAEFASLYTIYHIDTVSPVINRFCHQLFIGSLNLMNVFFFFYVDIKARGQKRYSLRQFFVRLLPAFFALFMVIFGELNYYIDVDTRYSYGPMALSVYISVAVYLLMALTHLLGPKSCFAKTEKYNLLPGIFIWAVVAIVQHFYPSLLISSLGVAVMVQFVYISFENPREYLELSLQNVMSRHAFELMLTELTQRKKTFYILAISTKETFSPYDSTTILQEMANTLKARSGKAVYSYGNSMIVSILTDPSEYSAALARNGLPSALQDVSGMFPLDYFLSAIECPKCAKDIESIESLLDFICREGQSREQTAGDVWVVDSDTLKKKEYLSQVEHLIRQTILEDGLEVYYQPIYCAETGTFSSCEALVRMKDYGSLGFVSPEVFIPMAEQCGLISELGLAVFDKVCAFASKYRLPERGVKYIEVNLSAIQSVDPHLPDTLNQCIRRYGLTPDFINLEITETAAVEAGDAFLANMEILRADGYHFSMDDFGTGYSNLAKIADTHYDLIKLDKSLLWPCFGEDGENALVVLDACIDMVHKLGASIVAEGVETEEQMSLLISRKVKYLQGYHFSRPLPESGYLAFLDAHS